MSIHAVRTKLANEERMCTSNPESGKPAFAGQPDYLILSVRRTWVLVLASWLAPAVGIQRNADTANSVKGIATLVQRL